MPSFPQLFTIDGSARHEVLLISPTIKLANLREQMQSATVDSPNCVEFMSKYKKAGADKIGEIKVKWSSAGRDPKTWPTSTTLTDDNIEAIMRMIMDSGVGKDVLEVKLEKPEEK